MKILLMLLMVVVTFGAYATDEVTESETTAQAIVDRMSCSDISARMVELSEIEEPDDDVTIELGKLKSDYRRKCMKSAGKRKTAAKNRVIITVEESASSPKEDVVEEKTEKTTETVEKQPEKIEEKVEEKVEKVEKTKTTETQPVSMEATDAEIKMLHELMNLDMGLCADGTKPNKFGCCTDEIFKDMGNNVYACCPKTGGDCYPPLK